ncbi:MAG TPA: RdgB/HAM1 family non-canonical purine NTP pyrophosphatase [Chloroflexota bacterium]|nr:RdgB/HAM1 family non-canonical purine NTP pyrophosphatase [Chloroflexota bacterium]
MTDGIPGAVAARPDSALLVATTNSGKIREIAALLSVATRRLVSPEDLATHLDVEETGATYADNALLKARAWFAATGMPTIAEDSGLEIDALGGAPGVFSARYLGLPDGPEKNARVLEALREVPPRRRRCRYVCVMALIDEDGTERTFEGRCAGVVALAPAGTGGFGFDPIVRIPRLGRTMAELAEAEKNRISHRARAAARLVRYLQSL